MLRALSAPIADTGEIGQLLVYMPIIVRSSDITDWERDFCASIIRQTRGSGRPPSHKQVGVMRRLVEKFKAVALADFDPIERGQGDARE